MNVIPADIGEFISYEPETGVLRWKRAQNSRSVPGSVCGTVSGTGYVGLKFRSVAYQAHRVAYFLMTGEQPGEIDHIDRDKANNAWRNLRDVSHAENMRNRAAPVGKYGRGITKRASGFRASIWHGGRHNHIGVFPTQEEAVAAFRAAANGGR